MENIYTDEDFAKLMERLNSLHEYSNGRWGRMTLPQMLGHCAIQLKLATGEVKSVKKEGSFLYKNMIGRWLSLYVIPWPRGIETPSVMDMEINGAKVGDFGTEKQQLVSLLDDVRTLVTLHAHPFYGNIHRKHWGRLVWVHLDHHLRQFGV
jgi:hypothetical protein